MRYQNFSPGTKPQTPFPAHVNEVFGSFDPVQGVVAPKTSLPLFPIQLLGLVILFLLEHSQHIPDQNDEE